MCVERRMHMYYPYLQETSRPIKRMMTLIGNGNLTVPPDTVQVQVEVQTEKEQLLIAQQENATAMNQIIEALLNFGIENEHIQTVSYNINPRYDYIDGVQQFRGYVVTNAIKITSISMEQISNIIDIAVQNGATSVSNIHFFVADDQATYEEALSLALQNATEKANVIAETMELQIVPFPIKIVEERRDIPSIPQLFVAKEMSGTTPIEPGQLIIHASVTVQFQF